MIEDYLRIVYVVLSLYALFVLATRWRVSRVLTRDRRYLFVFFLLEATTAAASGLIKFITAAPLDGSVWLTILTQSFLAAYLHSSVPRERRQRRLRRRST